VSRAGSETGLAAGFINDTPVDIGEITGSGLILVLVRGLVKTAGRDLILLHFYGKHIIN
jgi:hypothetical protein